MLVIQPRGFGTTRLVCARMQVGRSAYCSDTEVVCSSLGFSVSYDGTTRNATND